MSMYDARPFQGSVTLFLNLAPLLVFPLHLSAVRPYDSRDGWQWQVKDKLNSANYVAKARIISILPSSFDLPGAAT
jgi:hypothetical protein